MRYKLGALLLALLFPLTDAVSQCADSYLLQRETVLSQDVRILDEIEHATALVDGSWIVTTKDPGVFHFSPDGSYLRQFGREGYGPFEYTQPLQVRSDGETIAVWDQGNRKILVFGLNGERIREWTGFGRPISDFALHGDTLYAYSSGSATTDFVSVHAHESRGTPLKQLGEAPEGHRPLSFLSQSGGLTLDRARDRLLYVSPAALEVQVYDTQTGVERSWAIEDEAFDVASVQAPAQSLANPLVAGEHAFRSSRFYLVHAFDDRVVSVLQHGKLEYERSIADAVQEQAGGGAQASIGLGGIKAYTRRFHVHLTTHTGEPIACETVAFARGEVRSDSSIRGLTPRGFVVPVTRATPSDVTYVLVEYAVPAHEPEK
jgi:hypothetical protein